jgi:nicotinamide-nucleotide amidase
VGLVHFAAAKLKARLADGIDFAVIHHEERFGDVGRAEVRDRAADEALRLVLAAVDIR